MAVVTDGSAVLGLGDIGPEAAIPVMEGKCLIFKAFAGVDAFPLALATKDVDEIVRTVKAISPIFGGINLEDISAPRCFEIEERLQRDLDIPVFHDDQHGTAVVTLAALLNALKVVNKKLNEVKIVFTGAGASAIATAKLMMLEGARNIIACDRAGALYRGRTENMNPMKTWFAEHTNAEGIRGAVRDAMVGADVFIGLSGPGVVKVGRPRRDAPRRDRVRDGQPHPRDHAGGGREVREGHGHRPVGLPEPDQQLVRLPRLLQGPASTCGRAGSTTR